MNCLGEDEFSIIKANLEKINLEKTTLDKELERFVVNRQLLQQSIEKARSKRTQAIECRNKMQDALNMAKFKTEKVEAQTKSLELKNGELRERICRLQTELQLQLKCEEKDLSEFEEQLSQLSLLFVNAVTFYTPASLEGKNVKVEGDIQEMESRLSEVTLQVENLNSELEVLNSQLPAHSWDPDLPPEQRTLVLRMFQEERRALQEILDRVVSERNRTREALDGMSRNS